MSDQPKDCGCGDGEACPVVYLNPKPKPRIDPKDATIQQLREALTQAEQARDWERGLKEALLPYQERAVRAEAALAAMTQEYQDFRDRNNL